MTKKLPPFMTNRIPMRFGNIEALRRCNLPDCPMAFICSASSTTLIMATYVREETTPPPRDDGLDVIVSDADQVWRRVPHRLYSW